MTVVVLMDSTCLGTTEEKLFFVQITHILYIIITLVLIIVS